MSKPLDGIRVLDLSKVLAGPLCAQYLGDLGAEVIKVEAVGQGDETRGWPPFPAPGLGTVFLSANRNKRSIAINLKSDGGRALVHELAKGADVAIESFGTGVAGRLAIDADSLRALNERLIHCSISGFGRSGPLKNSPGYDVILQAFSGIMSMTGDEGGGYIRSPISPIDQMTGVHAFSGILASLLARERTGKGAAIQVSLFDTALGLLGYNLQTFWERGVIYGASSARSQALLRSSTSRNTGPTPTGSGIAPRRFTTCKRRSQPTRLRTGTPCSTRSAFPVRRSTRLRSCSTIPTPRRAASSCNTITQPPATSTASVIP